MKKLINCFIICICFQYISACGVTTHTAIGNKAFHLLDHHFPYRSLIEKHIDIFYASLMFPDWGYNCVIDTTNLKNASETAHWLPFQIETIKYLHQTYSMPWNEEAQKLIVFLFGIMSHSVADIIWHNLCDIRNINEGFIQAIANSDFNFDGNNYNGYIHGLADIGGEFMTNLQFNLSYLDNFALPYRDIINIYQQMGININEIELITCNKELYLETEIIRKFPDDLVYPYLSEKSPFLIDYFQEWWLGGINSLSTWTINCWENLKTMIDQNVVSPCYIYNGSQNYISDISQSKSIKKLYIPPKKTNFYDSCSVPTNYTVFRSSNKYSFLGAALMTCDLDGDGKNEIIISATGLNNRGGVYVLFYDNTWGKEIYVNDSKNKIIFISYDGNIDSKFGESLECLDINNDGYDDLIVGISGYRNNDQLKTNGKIQIYYGSMSGIGQQPNITVNTLVSYTNAGLSLKKNNNKLFIQNYLTNVDNNLGQGQILVLESSKYLTNQVINCTINNCTSPLVKIISLPSNYWGWGGFKSVPYDKYLIISEPLYNNSGRIYGYLNDKITWQIIDAYNNSRFGFNMMIINQTLIVSSPHNSDNKYVGAIYFFSLNNNIKPIRTIYAKNPYTRFGWSLTLDDKYIYVGEPNYQINQGAVHLISDTNSICYTFSNKKSYFGKNMITTSYGILVSAPLESYPMEHVGAVYLLH